MTVGEAIGRAARVRSAFGPTSTWSTRNAASRPGHDARPLSTRTRRASRRSCSPPFELKPDCVRSDEAHREPALSAIPGDGCARPARRTGEGRGALRARGLRDHRAGGLDGRRGEGREDLHVDPAELQVPQSVAAHQPRHCVRCGRRGGVLPGNARQARHPRRLPAGARRPIGQHRLPGARGHHPRHHAGRHQARRGRAARFQGGAARGCQRYRHRIAVRCRDVPARRLAKSPHA